MKKILVVLLIVVTTLSCFEYAGAAEQKAKSKSSWQIAKELCRKEGYHKIKLIETNKISDAEFWKIIRHRKGKPYIIVERVVSISNGDGYGFYPTIEGESFIIGYNKIVPKNKAVVSYVIWNPKSNVVDNVLYVVDNRTYRG